MSLAGIHQSLSADVRSSRNAGYLGTFVGPHKLHEVLTANNFMTRQKDTWTIERTAANATFGPVTYVSPASVSYSYTYTVTGSTTADDASDAQALFAQAPEITAYYDVTVSSSTITFTAKAYGYVATMTGSANMTTTNTVAGDDGVNLTVGRMVLEGGYLGGAGGADIYKAVYWATDTLSAQVVTDTFTGTIGAGDEVHTRAYVPALQKWTDWVVTEYNADEATTLAAHVVKLDTEYGTAFGAGYGIEAAVSGSTITHTADVAGYAFSIETKVVQTASGTWAVTQADTTGAIGSRSTDVTRRLLGIVYRGPGAVASADGADDAVYKPGCDVPVAPRGILRVTSSQTIADGDQVWLGVSGLLYNTGAAARVPIPKSLAVWRRDEDNSTAHVEIQVR